MSKTVMRVMMIGLVAMLGAKVEAHYYVAGGQARRCSVCVYAELAEHEEHSVNPATQIATPHREEVEFCVTTESVDIKCPLSKVKRLREPIRLVIQQPVTSKVESVVFPDSLFSKFCQGALPDVVVPDVVVHSMNLKIKTYVCSGPTKCEPVSKLEGECRLPENSNIGAPYDCSWRSPRTYQIDGPDEADGPDNDGSFDD